MKKKIVLYSKFWGCSILSVAVILLLFRFSDKLYVCNLIGIQFSSSLGEFYTLIGSNVEVLKSNIGLDYLFIMVYSLLFVGSLKVFELSLQTKLKTIYYLLCFIPGIFDLVENLMTLDLINNNNVKKFNLFRTAVFMKWTTIIPFIIMSLTIILYYVMLVFGKVYNKIFDNK